MENVLKKINIIFAVALIVSLLSSLFTYITKTKETIYATDSDKIERISILIDPGHGGVDQGASGSLDTLEAPINLSISEKLMMFLQVGGFEADITRYGDYGLSSEGASTIRAKKNEDLNTRVDLINQADADIVLSIHLNAFPEEKYYGAHVFYQKDNPNGKVAAKILQESLKNVLDKNNDRVPQVKKGVRVLDNTDKTVLLVECGFLSNFEEEKKLMTDEYQEKIAWALYLGLLNYFNQQTTASTN